MKFSGFISYCLHGAKNIVPDGAEFDYILTKKTGLIY